MKYKDAAIAVLTVSALWSTWRALASAAGWALIDAAGIKAGTVASNLGVAAALYLVRRIPVVAR